MCLHAETGLKYTSNTGKAGDGMNLLHKGEVWFKNPGYPGYRGSLWGGDCGNISQNTNVSLMFFNKIIEIFPLVYICILFNIIRAQILF